MRVMMLRSTTSTSNHSKTMLISLYCERECEFELITASMTAEDSMSICGRRWNAFCCGEEVQYIIVDLQIAAMWEWECESIRGKQVATGGRQITTAATLSLDLASSWQSKGASTSKNS